MGHISSTEVKKDVGLRSFIIIYNTKKADKVSFQEISRIYIMALQFPDIWFTGLCGYTGAY